MVAAALAITIGGGAVLADETGFLGSGGSRSTGLFAAEVRLATDLPGGSVEGTQPLEIIGSAIDCAPAGVGPEDTQQRFFQEGESFEVTGTLASFDAITVVVSGPNGDVSASLAQEFELRGDLSPGAMVEMTGAAATDGALTAQQVHSACAAAGVIDCAGADDPHFELWVAGGSFEVTGRLEGLTANQIRVIGPGLIVEIARDAGTQVDSSIKAGDPVKVEGTVLDDQSLRALALNLRCTPALIETPSPVNSAPASRANEVSEDDESGEEGVNEACNHRPRGRGALRFEVDDGEAEIKRGAVLAQDGSSLTVETPAGPITVLVDEDTEIKGNLDTALDVRVKGDLQQGDSILAEGIKVLCPAGNGGNDEDDKEKSDDEGEENGRGRGRSNGNSNGNGNGNGNDRGNGDQDESEDDD
jgi:hypothetical protein